MTASPSILWLWCVPYHPRSSHVGVILGDTFIIFTLRILFFLFLMFLNQQFIFNFIILFDIIQYVRIILTGKYFIVVFIAIGIRKDKWSGNRSRLQAPTSHFDQSKKLVRWKWRKAFCLSHLTRRCEPCYDIDQWSRRLMPIIVLARTQRPQTVSTLARLHTMAAANQYNVIDTKRRNRQTIVASTSWFLVKGMLNDTFPKRISCMIDTNHLFRWLEVDFIWRLILLRK